MARLIQPYQLAKDSSGDKAKMSKVGSKVVAQGKAVQILKKLKLFQDLSDDEYIKVLGMCSSVSVQKGEMLFRQRDEGKSLFILLHGEINIHVEGKGIVHTMQAGDILGEMALVCKIKRTGSAVVAKNSVLLQLYAEILHEVVNQHPRIGYIIMRNVSAYLAERLLQNNKTVKPLRKKEAK